MTTEQRALILPVKGVMPIIGQDCFLAPNATLTGDVQLGDRCSVWFQAVIRGDVHSIRIGEQTNIQDGAIIHATYQKASTQIGARVSIGHQAMIHGCTLHDHVLVGMGAIILDHAVVESYCLIAAGSVVLEGTVCESGHLYAGVPARKIKPLTDEQKALIDRTADHYVAYASWYDQ
ncbi:MAG: gamma carbonic anhydrase family protein [Bacteroidetes bacterium]|nr:gamma carbonic anhydrase family protein [Bacteroidota bacterium]